MRRGLRELVGLILLFGVLIFLASYYEQLGQEQVGSNAPTTENSRAEGVRALYLLYQREGFRTEPLKAPWNELTPRDGLLVFVEPPAHDRPLHEQDIKVLEAWVRRGGTLLDLVADPPVEQPLDVSNHLAGDCGAIAGSSEQHEVRVNADAHSPLLSDVSTLAVSSRQRLYLADHAPYTVLARDPEGLIAVEKSLGKGHVILISNRYGATNAGLGQADNAVLLVTIARASTQNGTAVRFDEYHHGVGFAERPTMAVGVWSSLPLSLRLATLYLLGVGALLLYNGNRRFGPAQITRPVALRSSTDYVRSIARLYRRAGGGDIAIEILYGRLLRDLKRTLDLPAEAGPSVLSRAATQRFGPAAGGLQEILAHGEAIAAGQRVNDADMLKLAQQIEQFRRACQLAGV